jgi:uncharacterized protein
VNAAEQAPLWRRRVLHRLTWDGFDRVVRAIADGVRSGGPVDCVLGISRGGLVPAVALSSQLGVASLHVVSVSRNVGSGQYLDKQPPTVTWTSDLEALREQHVLVVDDVAGTGATLELVRSRLNMVAASVRTVVLVRMVRGNAHAELVGIELDDWVLFPWEADELPPDAEVSDVPVRGAEAR